MSDYDLVIRGGTVVNGLGDAPIQADVAITKGRIVAVGPVTGKGREEIDASGLTVTPGFVDVHTHFDGQITWENRLVPSSDHGVTTVVMGNCGVGFAPVRETDHQMVIKLMEGVEDIPEIVMANGVPWNWESFTDYLDALDRREGDVDFAAQIPHSPLRVYVMGQRGANLEQATAQDLKEMRRLVAEGIRAGALGVSTSRNLFHRFRTGKYAPSVTAEVEELLQLAGGLSDAGSGVFQLNPNIDTHAGPEMAVIGQIARASGRPVNYSLIPIRTQPDNWNIYLDGTAALNTEGLKVTGQFLARPIGVLFGLDLSYHPFALNPSFREIAALPLAEKVKRMRDPDLRRTILAEQPDDPNPVFVAMVTMKHDLYPVGDPANYNFQPEDSLAARAERLGRDEREVIYDALLENEGHAILCAYSANVRDYLARTNALFSRDDMVTALGDGGAHYAMVCDATYTTYILSQRLGEPGLDLPTVIHSLTSKPARSLGLHDRGVIAEGYKADLNVIDLDRVAVRRPTVKADLPAGGKRISQKADGYVATIVSGVVTYREGKSTGALPGRLIRGTQPGPAVQAKQDGLTTASPCMVQRSK